MNCFGRLSRDSGQTLVPEPPHMMIGRIFKCLSPSQWHRGHPGRRLFPCPNPTPQMPASNPRPKTRSHGRDARLSFILPLSALPEPVGRDADHRRAGEPSEFHFAANFISKSLHRRTKHENFQILFRYISRSGGEPLAALAYLDGPIAVRRRSHGLVF